MAPVALPTATISLPTAGPSPEKTPTSTRVLPIESLTPGPTPTITPIPDEVRAFVVGVIDGQTLAVVMQGDSPNRIYGVRYLGINTPRPGTPWGIPAYETNRKLAGLKVVRLVRDVTDLDDEGYLLRYVFVGDELLNVTLTEQGLARAEVKPPDTRFEAEILKAETQAKAEQLGLWGGTPTPTPTAGPDEEEGTIEPSITITSSATITVTIEATIEIGTPPTGATGETTVTPTPSN
ncbi:MAG: thermonuclease family protein [Anaerolineae bacterium]|nr:thermonuclease family protein [Anaerolineae bacterium]